MRVWLSMSVLRESVLSFPIIVIDSSQNIFFINSHSEFGHAFSINVDVKVNS